MTPDPHRRRGGEVLSVILVTAVAIMAGQGALWVLEQGFVATAGGEGSIWWNPGTGAFWAMSICVSGGVELAVVGLWLWTRSGGDWRETLAIRPVSGRVLVFWGFMGLLFAFICDGVTWLAGRPVVPEVMREAYRTAGGTVFFWLALVGLAPFVEEVVFRGLLFGGVEASVLGPWGAMGLSTGLWVATHGQYDAWGLAIVVLAGLLLGWVRWRTRSVIVTWWMHTVLNAIAVVEAMLIPLHASTG